MAMASEVNCAIYLFGLVTNLNQDDLSGRHFQTTLRF